MEPLDLNMLREQAQRYPSQLRTAEEDVARHKEELREVCDYIDANQTLDRDKEHKNVESLWIELSGPLRDLTFCLSRVIQLLAAKKLPLSDEIYRECVGAENIWHRHTGRYTFVFLIEDASQDTVDSVPQCIVEFPDGRIVPNPGCHKIGLEADIQLQTFIIEEKLRIEAAIERIEIAKRQWRNYRERLLGNAGPLDYKSRQLESFRQQLLETGLPSEIIATKLDELRQKLGLN